MVCPPKGLKVDLDNQPLTMTTRLLPTANAFAHKSAHYPRVCENPLDTKRHQRSSGAVKPPGRKQHIADRLILMGVWRDSSQPQFEETGAVRYVATEE